MYKHSSDLREISVRAPLVESYVMLLVGGETKQCQVPDLKSSIRNGRHDSSTGAVHACAHAATVASSSSSLRR
jgi:hypothetical protein